MMHARQKWGTPGWGTHNPSAPSWPERTLSLVCFYLIYLFPCFKFWNHLGCLGGIQIWYIDADESTESRSLSLCSLSKNIHIPKQKPENDKYLVQPQEINLSWLSLWQPQHGFSDTHWSTRTACIEVSESERSGTLSHASNMKFLQKGRAWSKFTGNSLTVFSLLQFSWSHLTEPSCVSNRISQSSLLTTLL